MIKFTNSSLVKYTKLSPNHSGLRNHDIDTITIHCLVGHGTLEGIGEIFYPASRKASCNYAVDDDGRIGMYVEEKNRSWCTSSSSNDNRAITIEVACDAKDPYKVTSGALSGLIKLCTDICERNNIKELLWKGDKNLIGQVNKQNMTVHRWFANKECPGDYLYAKHEYIAAEVNKLLNKSNNEEIKTPAIPQTTFIPYTVKITAVVLNVRKDPGVNSKSNGFVYKNQVYTIIEETKGSGASKWGKLKSGSGWISLDHCQRL